MNNKHLFSTLRKMTILITVTSMIISCKKDTKIDNKDAKDQVRLAFEEKFHLKAITSDSLINFQINQKATAKSFKNFEEATAFFEKRDGEPKLSTVHSSPKQLATINTNRRAFPIYDNGIYDEVGVYSDITIPAIDHYAGYNQFHFEVTSPYWEGKQMPETYHFNGSCTSPGSYDAENYNNLQHNVISSGTTFGSYSYYPYDNYSDTSVPGNNSITEGFYCYGLYTETYTVGGVFSYYRHYNFNMKIYVRFTELLHLGNGRQWAEGLSAKVNFTEIN